ncbi:hypothetical protein GCM10020295_74190 [Streptomyces cinereospinus]
MCCPLGPTAYRLLLAVPADRAEESERGAALMRALLTQKRIGVVLRDTRLSVVRSNFTEAGLVPLPSGSRLADVVVGSDAAKAEAELRGGTRDGHTAGGSRSAHTCPA